MTADTEGGVSPPWGELDPDQLVSLVDRTPAGLLLVDENGRIRYGNAAAARMLGQEDLAGTSFGFPLTSRRPSRIELRDGGGGAREVEMRVTALRSSGELSWLVTMHDVSHRDEESRRLLEEVQQRDDAVAMASHELRSPLAAMAAATQALAQQWEDMPPIRRLSLLRRILEQTWRMDDTIGRVLDATGLDAGLFVAAPEPSSVLDVILDGAPHLRDLADSLDLRVPETATVQVAPAHLWTIVSNLLVNATKFAGGLVTVEAVVDDGWCRLVVSDQGPGVPATDRDRVFERYARLDRDADLGGLGLGLWIVRGIAESYGGRAWCEPAEPVGSRFVVRLPAAGLSLVPDDRG